jgi:hypothetical protein
MARRGSLPWCSICRHGYRGIYPVHASTASHLAAAGRRSSKRITNRYDLNRSLGIPHINVRRALSGGDESGMVKVHRYKRRRPLDGPARSVGVVRHWRGRPDIFRASSYIPAVKLTRYLR